MMDQERPESEMAGREREGSLESSLLQLVQDHNQTSLKLHQQTGTLIFSLLGFCNFDFNSITNPNCALIVIVEEKAKKDALRSAIRVSDLLVDTVNGGVHESFVNEKRIESEIRVITSTIARFTKQTDQWLAASHGLNTALKVWFLFI
ncbi:hypothetical protein GIB67_041186 [Kingdonia uniflora]|uniref:Biogenesis of lysosome-related organelles complex 1 subunit 1 n=1 Tax=Kingdonia uniflora TaxID=39325 RepID=A0A7J7LKR6_9MAGN|nr:hypothetical protein GIB67_041186 [Kingdonia uniflora]